MDIQEFLLARIAEDEVAAAKPLTDLPVTRVYHPHTIEGVPGLPGVTVETTAHYQMKAQPVTATYNADPARVLRECAAKRELIDAWHDEHGGGHVLKTLASVYSDHPDYQQEWSL